MWAWCCGHGAVGMVLWAWCCGHSPASFLPLLFPQIHSLHLLPYPPPPPIPSTSSHNPYPHRLNTLLLSSMLLIHLEHLSLQGWRQFCRHTPSVRPQVEGGGVLLEVEMEVKVERKGKGERSVLRRFQDVNSF